MLKNHGDLFILCPFNAISAESVRQGAADRPSRPSCCDLCTNTEYGFPAVKIYCGMVSGCMAGLSYLPCQGH